MSCVCFVLRPDLQCNRLGLYLGRICIGHDLLADQAVKLVKGDPSHLIPSFSTWQLPEGHGPPLSHMSLNLMYHPSSEELSAEWLHPELLSLDLRGSPESAVMPSWDLIPRLRYLDLSHSQLHELPTAVTGLPDLEVLRLRCCRKLMSLPADISKMASLR